MEYSTRFYRKLFRQDDLVYFQVVIRQTDLSIGVRRDRYSTDLKHWVENLIHEQRTLLERYIGQDNSFLHSLSPCPLKPGAPPMAVDMAEVSRLAGVGPMAAVAGAFAQYVGSALARRSKDVVVENGGDIYLRSTRTRSIGIFAGESPLSNRIALEIKPEDTPLGICTSSGTVGPSLSLGRADAAVVVAHSAILADAVATAAANMVENRDDIKKAAEYATSIEGVRGALIIKDDHLAACGDLKIVPFQTGP